MPKPDEMHGLKVQPALEWNGNHRHNRNGRWSQLPVQLGSDEGPPNARPASHAAIVQLRDGRLLVIGGLVELPSADVDGEHDHNAVEANHADSGSERASNVVTAAVHVLSSDGHTWTTAASMLTPRYGAVAGLLPSGNVIVAGGRDRLPSSEDDPDLQSSMDTVEVWDALKNEWTKCESMLEARFGATGCVLPSGAFAVVGGLGNREYHFFSEKKILSTCEVFVEDSAHEHLGRWRKIRYGSYGAYRHCSTAVAGGMIVVGGIVDDESDYAYQPTPLKLFDEQEQSWFRLPCQEHEEILRDEDWQVNIATDWPPRDDKYPWDTKRFNMKRQRGVGIAMVTCPVHLLTFSTRQSHES